MDAVGYRTETMDIDVFHRLLNTILKRIKKKKKYRIQWRPIIIKPCIFFTGKAITFVSEGKTFIGPRIFLTQFLTFRFEIRKSNR